MAWLGETLMVEATAPERARLLKITLTVLEPLMITFIL